jgi:hypothetical protein
MMENGDSYCQQAVGDRASFQTIWNMALEFLGEAE